MLLFAYGGAALLLAEFLRKQLPFLQRLMIPNAFVAGLIVLLCSEQVLGIMKISLDQLTTVVYHLLTGIFILVGLRGARRFFLGVPRRDDHDLLGPQEAGGKVLRRPLSAVAPREGSAPWVRLWPCCAWLIRDLTLPPPKSWPGPADLRC